MPKREEYVVKRRISMTAPPENYLLEMALLFSKKQTFYIVSSAYQLLLEGPFPIFFRLYRNKSQKFCRLWNFNYLQHTQLQKKMCILHICHHSAGKRKNPRYATRFPAFELQWCIWNTTSWLQAALQGHKQMVWYYSPDLGLPSVNRVLIHHCKIRDWKCKCVFLFLYQNVHDISILLPIV